MEFDHEKLAKGAIRLISLEPSATKADVLRCKISHRVVKRISDPDYQPESFTSSRLEAPSINPGYQTISYTWGPSEPCHLILLNGKQLRKRDNIWRFLLLLRESKEARRLWVDSICIDQNNLAEKNAQVARMEQIFQEQGARWYGLEKDLTTAIA